MNSFWRMAIVQPDHPAIIDANGQITSYEGLSQLSNRIVHTLYSLGLNRGDSVALLGKSDRDFLAITLATLQSGMRLIPLNFNHTNQQILCQLNNCKPELLIVASGYISRLKSLSKNLELSSNRCFALGENSENFLNLHNYLETQSTTYPLDRCAGEFSFITSGTTGPPKVIIRPIRFQDPDEKALDQVNFLKMVSTPDKTSLFLSTLPLFYSLNLFMAVSSLHLGHTLLLMEEWSIDQFCSLIKNYPVKETLMLPVMFEHLLCDSLSRKHLRSSNLERIVHSGARCPIDLKLRMIDLVGPKLLELYAGAEGGGTFITSEQWLRKPGSVGLPWPISLVKIFDDLNRELPPGESGRVFMKTMNQSFEYLKDLKGTEQVWQSDFFTLDDRGYLDRDGFLFLEKIAGEKSIL